MCLNKSIVLPTSAKSKSIQVQEVHTPDKRHLTPYRPSLSSLLALSHLEL